MIRPHRLSITDFRVIERADLVLDSLGLVMIRGVNDDTTAADSNGAGKTTLFDAISWCLYGQTVAEGKVTDPIRVGASKCSVSVEFDDGDHTYTVERSRTGAGTNLKLKTDGVSTTSRGAKDTQAIIEDLLGLDWHAFSNTVLYGQGDVRRFADPTATDTERKAILKRILRLDVLDKALAEVREQARAARATLAVVDDRIKVAKAAEDEARNAHAAMSARERAWEASRVARALEARKKVDALNDQIKDLDGAAAQAEKLKALVTGYMEELQELPAAYKRRTAAAEALAQAKGELLTLRATANGKKSIADATLKARQKAENAATTAEVAYKRLLDLKVCPVCATPTDESEHTQAHLRSMADDVDRLRDDVGIADAAYRAAEAERIEAERPIASAIKRQKEAETEAEAAKADVIALEALSEKHGKLQEKLKIAEAAANSVAVLTARVESARADQDAIAAEENPHTEALDDAERRIGDLQAEREGHTVDRDAAASIVEHIKFWETGFSNKGLPSMIMEGALPVIAESANKYLMTLADGDIFVTISPTTENKGEGVREEINISVEIEGLKDVRPSHAQRRKVAIAIDLALMDLVASRESGQMAFLMMDEVLDGLDAEGRTRVVELLKELASTKETVMVVSHDGAIAEHFEQSITVRKVGKKSTVEIS